MSAERRLGTADALLEEDLRGIAIRRQIGAWAGGELGRTQQGPAYEDCSGE